MSVRKSRNLVGSLVLLAVGLLSTAALAQDQQPSKVDVFAGYAWADPGSHGFGGGIKSSAEIGFDFGVSRPSEAESPKRSVRQQGRELGQCQAVVSEDV